MLQWEDAHQVCSLVCYSLQSAEMQANWIGISQINYFVRPKVVMLVIKLKTIYTTSILH